MSPITEGTEEDVVDEAEGVAENTMEVNNNNSIYSFIVHIHISTMRFTIRNTRRM